MQTAMSFATDNRLPEIRDRLSAISPDSPANATDPMRQLIYGMITEGVAPSVGLAIFNRLRTKFLSWSALRDANPDCLEPIFIGLPNARHKAEALPAALLEIDQRAGGLDLELLKKLSSANALRWLSSLPGVSDSVASAVLAFSTLERPVVSIDLDCARVVRRLGLCPPSAAASSLARHVAERAPSHWQSRDFAALSEGLQTLGRRNCHKGEPKCDNCMLAQMCPTAVRATASVIPFRRPTNFPLKSEDAIMQR